ncbi:MAG: sel1 repeat family protein, partial [Betaproteobacteria bacterium]|nr:sel1 repeat family protein [Betaproteobacteria bacterium]
GKAQAAQSAKSAAAKQGKDAKTLKDEDSRSSKELAVVYQRLSEQAEKATACIFDPKCLSSDRKVLQLMVQRREVLERLAARAQQGDLEAGYWRGTIAMEQARRQVNRGELNSDDLGARKEAMLITAVGAEEFRTAARFLQSPADKGMPDACDRIAEILANGYGMFADIKRAAEYYRCAGLGFLKEGRKDEVAQVIGKMRGFLPPNHMYIVELYAKLITREPSYPWRIPTETAALLEKSAGWGKVPGPGDALPKSYSGKTQ